MQLKTCYQINAFLSWREIDGQTVAVDSQEGKVYQFNEVAAAIWKSLDGTRSVDDIAAELSKSYEVEPKKIQKDIALFLKKLFQDDLIVEAASR